MHRSHRASAALVRLLGGLLVALGLAGPASATWSIILVNTRTREVVVAGATCVGGDLASWIGLVQVGRGAACVQSVVNVAGKAPLWEAMAAGKPPSKILEILTDPDPLVNQRQYGIVTLDDDPRTFSGQLVGQARRGIAAQVGELKYAIQGNVLAGQQVIVRARNRMLNTEGTLLDKVMAGMERARQLGGDGRCSCSVGAPASCGTPPPDFVRTCDSAFVISARLGDTDDPDRCLEFFTCVGGDYFLDLRQPLISGGVDPVIVMRERYDLWRLSRAGRVDHVSSHVTPGASELVADGRSSMRVTVKLADLDGYPIAETAPRLVVRQETAGEPMAKPGPIKRLAHGEYAFELRANARTGHARFFVEVFDGPEPKGVRLSDSIDVRFRPAPPDGDTSGVR